MAGEPGAAGHASCRPWGPSRPPPRLQEHGRLRGGGSSLSFSAASESSRAPTPALSLPQDSWSQAPSTAHRPGRPHPAALHCPPSGSYLRDYERRGPRHRHVPYSPSLANFRRPAHVPKALRSPRSLGRGLCPVARLKESSGRIRGPRFLQTPWKCSHTALRRHPDTSLSLWTCGIRPSRRLQNRTP